VTDDPAEGVDPEQLDGLTIFLSHSWPRDREFLEDAALSASATSI
jgi:hypothetical protein